MVFPSLSTARYRYAHLLRTLMDVSLMRQLAERGRRHCSSFTPKFATEPFRRCKATSNARLPATGRGETIPPPSHPGLS